MHIFCPLPWPDSVPFTWSYMWIAFSGLRTEACRHVSHVREPPKGTGILDTAETGFVACESFWISGCRAPWKRPCGKKSWRPRLPTDHPRGSEGLYIDIAAGRAQLDFGSFGGATTARQQAQGWKSGKRFWNTSQFLLTIYAPVAEQVKAPCKKHKPNPAHQSVVSLVTM